MYKLNKVAEVTILFWLMKIVATTFGDFLTKPLTKDGLDLGTLAATFISLGIIILLVTIAHYNEREKQHFLAML